MSPNPMGEARAWAVGALSALDGVTVWGEPPEVVTPPGVIVGPCATGWAERTRVSGRANVRLDLTVLVAQAAGRSALDRLEELLWAVMNCPGIVPVEQVPAPERRSFGQSECLAATVTVHVLADCNGG